MICDLDTKMWSDPWFESLQPKAKLLFIYLWTNNHKNLPCLYEITIATISREIGYKPAEVKKLLKELHPKVRYSEEDNLLWVVNSVRRQFLKSVKVSDKIVKGLENALRLIPEGHPLIGEFLNKYKVLNIPYTYPIQRVSGYPSGEGEDVGEGKGSSDIEESILYKEIVEHLNETLDTSYQHTTQKTQDLIKARWNEGYHLEDFKRVHEIKHADWKDTNMATYLRPETLYGNKFESYLNQKPLPTKQEQTAQAIKEACDDLR